MRMSTSAIWLFSGALLALLVGPTAVLTTQVGRPDPADLYIVIDALGPPLSEQELEASGGIGVGPLRGVIAEVVHAPPSSREQLAQAGYIMLPAGKLASICGIQL